MAAQIAEDAAQIAEDAHIAKKLQEEEMMAQQMAVLGDQLEHSKGKSTAHMWR